MSKQSKIRAAQREYAREWREKNREEYNEYMREYRKKNPEKIQAIKERHLLKKYDEMEEAAASGEGE